MSTAIVKTRSNDDLDQCFSTVLASRNSIRQKLKKRLKPKRKTYILLSPKFKLCTYAGLHGLCSYMNIIAYILVI